ncbi:MAG: ribonuclease III [Sphingobacteriia bacterium]|nr:ribonuclease III [Sphingobacteriia bacterium]
MQFLKRLFQQKSASAFEEQLKNMLGIIPGNVQLYRNALSHRSVKDTPDENNERLEFLGDAVLSSVVADYLFKRYPYKGEGFLTEMRSKMVNRQQLNDIALKMGLRKLTIYNRFDNALKGSQIFGNTLEALIGAVYLDKGYRKTQNWILKQIVIPHLFVEDLELIDINLKNKLIGWANKNGKTISFDLAEERLEGNRRVFTMNAVLDGEVFASGRGNNKKDASQIAAQIAVEKLGL